MSNDTATHTSDTPQLLLEHHLKELRLPTMLREYDHIARQCAVEQVDYLLAGDTGQDRWQGLADEVGAAGEVAEGGIHSTDDVPGTLERDHHHGYLVHDIPDHLRIARPPGERVRFCGSGHGGLQTLAAGVLPVHRAGNALDTNSYVPCPP